MMSECNTSANMESYLWNVLVLLTLFAVIINEYTAHTEIGNDWGMLLLQE